VKRAARIITLLLSVVAVYVTKAPAGAQTTNVSGLWSGTTLVTPCYFSGGRCNAQNKITLKLTQQNNRITGSYACAFGTMICRHGGADDTGKVISGRIFDNQVRLSVLIPADVSNCYYNGMLTSATTMHGTYMCFNGGDLVEEGMWDVKLASG
jgi:hypothetical protein